MKCKECRHLIDYYEDGRISCEIHSPERVEQPDKCKAYLNMKCKDKEKIRRNVKIVDDINLEAKEEMLG